MIQDVKDLTSFKWATVTDTNPIEIKLDGDSAPLALIPDCLVDPHGLEVGDRVRVELSQRKVVIHGKANGETAGLLLSEQIVFESSGTFQKANYPGIKALRVRVVGGGGSGGGSSSTASGQNSYGTGGGGGGYAEKLITDIDALPSSVTVTVGSGGVGTAGDGNTGGSSSFGDYAAATGGTGGLHKVSSTLGGYLPGGVGGVGTVGDLLLGGGGGSGGWGAATLAGGGAGGSSPMGGGGRTVGTGASSAGNAGDPGSKYGGGGGGAATNTTGPGRLGGNGGPGVVIVEVYR